MGRGSIVLEREGLERMEARKESRERFRSPGREIYLPARLSVKEKARDRQRRDRGKKRYL